MSPLNHRRGHESAEHRRLKLQVAALLRDLGYWVACEVLDCDVATVHRESGRIVAVEIERSPRNLRRNLQRNHDRGCNGQILVYPAADEPAIRRGLSRLPMPVRRAVVGLPMEELSVERLRAALDSLPFVSLSPVRIAGCGPVTPQPPAEEA